MSFFIRKNKFKKHLGGEKQSKKRKKELVKSSKKKPEKPPALNGDLDENVTSDSEISDGDNNNKKYQAASSDDEEETAQEKRLRLAKLLVEEITEQEKERAEAEEIDRDVIAHRLREDVAEQSGKLYRKVADNLHFCADDAFSLRGHQRSLTCVVISSDNQYVYTGSKDCTIIKWSVANCKKVKVIPRGPKNKSEKMHSAHILCLAISSDNKFLVSGCENKIIHVWNPDTMDHIRAFTGHRDSIMGLVFRKNSHQLFSASKDRSVKIWNLDEMAYVETLFGHQDSITSIDSLIRDRAITCGARDNSLRIWKIVEESQLVFNGHVGFIDCVRFINEDYFASCGDDGTIALWGILKKKPLFSLPDAHGVNPENNQANFIISLASFQYTDVIASGSSDGQIRLWKSGVNFRSLTEIGSCPVAGHVNSMQFASDGSFLVAAVGQEHRLGRWSCQKKARNVLTIIPLKFNNES